jgi:hypothetical protein
MATSQKSKRGTAKRGASTESLDITRNSLKARGRKTVFLVVVALGVVALAWVLVHESKPNVIASGPNSTAIGVSSGPLTINNGKEPSK